MALNQAQIQQIAESIKKGQCVPFLGAAANIKHDASDKCEAYDGLPLGIDVSRALALEMQDPGIRDDTNLPKVSLVYEQTLQRSGLIERLKALLPDDDRMPSRLLMTLARLPLELYITTNYDRLLERALAMHGRKPLVVVQTAESLEGASNLTQWLAADPRPPLVYKIHGTFRDPEPAADPAAFPIDTSPVIITEDDYIDFLTLLGSPKKGFPKVISSRVQSSTVLFLGYSLEDWDFRVIYKAMMRTFENKRFLKPRYSIQKSAPDYWVGFWRDQKVTILEADIYEFADALAAACGLDDGGANAG